jgi:hypothetical protein
VLVVKILKKIDKDIERLLGSIEYLVQLNFGWEKKIMPIPFTSFSNP